MQMEHWALAKADFTYSSPDLILSNTRIRDVQIFFMPPTNASENVMKTFKRQGGITGVCKI